MTGCDNVIEKEVKIMLSQTEYDLVCNLFGYDEIIEQCNNYYISDTSRRLSTTIRVREKDGCFFLQIKMPVSEDGSLSIKKEFCKEVQGVDKLIKDETIKELTGVSLGDCRLVGSLKTERRVKYIGDSIEICIDKSSYFGKIDYEIEIEYTGEYPYEQVKLLQENGIECGVKACGKYRRFMNELNRQG